VEQSYNLYNNIECLSVTGSKKHPKFAGVEGLKIKKIQNAAETGRGRSKTNIQKFIKDKSLSIIGKP
jgi:hypothetical protein